MYDGDSFDIYSDDGPLSIETTIQLGNDLNDLDLEKTYSLNANQNGPGPETGGYAVQMFRDFSTGDRIDSIVEKLDKIVGRGEAFCSDIAKGSLPYYIYLTGIAPYFKTYLSSSIAFNFNPTGDKRPL